MLVAVLLFLIPAVPGWHGDPDRHSLAVATIPVAVVLLCLYTAVTYRGLRRHQRLQAETDAQPGNGWSLPDALLVLAAATTLTASSRTEGKAVASSLVTSGRLERIRTEPACSS